MPRRTSRCAPSHPNKSTLRGCNCGGNKDITKVNEMYGLDAEDVMNVRSLCYDSSFKLKRNLLFESVLHGSEIRVILNYLLVVHLIMILALWLGWIENKTQGLDICSPGRLASVDPANAATGCVSSNRTRSSSAILG